MKLIAGIAALLLITVAVPQERAKSTLTLPKTAKAGKAFKGTVTVTFPTGWHGYQNPPTKNDGTQNPLEVTSADKNVTIKATYPKGEMKEFIGELSAVYEGTVKIPITVTVKGKAGKKTIKVNVHWQQCDANSCLPPLTVTLSSAVTLK